MPEDPPGPQSQPELSFREKLYSKEALVHAHISQPQCAYRCRSADQILPQTFLTLKAVCSGIWCLK